MSEIGKIKLLKMNFVKSTKSNNDIIFISENI